MHCGQAFIYLAYSVTKTRLPKSKMYLQKYASERKTFPPFLSQLRV